MGTFMNVIEKYMSYEIIVLTWLLYFWELYLSLRQRKLLKKVVDLPEEAKNVMTKDVFDKARLYALDRNTFGFFDNLYSQCFNTFFILAFAHYYCWIWSVALAKHIGLDHENEVSVSAVYVFIKILISNVIGLPFTIYSVFVLEEKHGFNKQKPLFFVKDQLLKLVVLEVFAVPFSCGTIWIIKNGGDYFFLYLWIFFVAVTLFMMIIYPEVIAPLFDKYYPLPEGELKRRIEELAASVKFPLYKLFIVEGSKRSSHSNAYLYGFYKHKRIVLFDTLVKEYYKPDQADLNKDIGCDTEEVLGVLAHELAHWRYSHTLKGLLLAQINFIISINIFAKLLYYKPMYVAFGFYDVQPIFIGLIIVAKYILLPFNTVMHVILGIIKRKFEFEADAHAAELGYAEPLKRALIKLQKDNLQFPVYDKLFSAWHHSHPPILERLEAIDKKAR